MLMIMIALLFMCRCGLWVRGLLLFSPLLRLMVLAEHLYLEVTDI